MMWKTYLFYTIYPETKLIDNYKEKQKLIKFSTVYMCLITVKAK